MSRTNDGSRAASNALFPPTTINVSIEPRIDRNARSARMVGPRPVTTGPAEGAAIVTS